MVKLSGVLCKTLREKTGNDLNRSSFDIDLALTLKVKVKKISQKYKDQHNRCVTAPADTSQELWKLFSSRRNPVEDFEEVFFTLQI